MDGGGVFEPLVLAVVAAESRQDYGAYNVTAPTLVLPRFGLDGAKVIPGGKCELAAEAAVEKGPSRGAVPQWSTALWADIFGRGIIWG